MGFTEIIHEKDFSLFQQNCWLRILHNARVIKSLFLLTNELCCRLMLAEWSLTTIR